MQRRTVALADQSVVVVAGDARAAAIADFVCAALATGTEPASAGEVQANVLGGEAESAEELMRALAVRLVTDYGSGLALHAAAVEHAGHAVLFPAVSGAGKSTLAVYLAARGFRFLTDELVLIPSGGTTVHPLARPAHLKAGSMFVLERLPGLAGSSHVRSYPRGALIAPAAFARPPLASLPLGAVVFPRFAPDAASHGERLSPGIAGYSLLAALVNARNLPQLGVAECARLVASVPCHRVSYRTLEELEAALDPIAAAIGSSAPPPAP